HHQTREEAHGAAREDVGDGWEGLPVDREGAVWIPPADRHVREQEVVLVPPKPGDLVSDLLGALHVVVADGPEMAASGHVLAFVHGGLPVASCSPARRCPLRSMSSWHQRAP